jgi:hypothetical protein
MKKVVITLVAALMLMPAIAGAQSGQGGGAGRGAGSIDAQAATATTQDNKALIEKIRQLEAAQAKIEAQNNPRFVRTLTNVQIEFTLTDQQGSAAPEKKTVSMIVSSGNWGKVRSAGSVIQIGDAPYGVDLGIDARPFVSTDGPIQLELVLNYAPPKGAADPREPKQRPTGINQSQTVVLTSGKPLVISQAADPLSDRKVVVEVKATVLK